MLQHLVLRARQSCPALQQAVDGDEEPALEVRRLAATEACARSYQDYITVDNHQKLVRRVAHFQAVIEAFKSIYGTICWRELLAITEQEGGQISDSCICSGTNTERDGYRGTIRAIQGTEVLQLYYEAASGG